MNKDTTHFGYQQVPLDKKAGKVAGVFHAVADRYDVMNDLMSFGVHRLWKRFTIALANVKAKQAVLDIAGGTGDLTKQFAKQVGPQGQVTLADINSSMLQKGRERLIDAGVINNVSTVQADAEALPFANNSFHCISIAFGLRNVTNIDAALASMFRVLKPGGQLLVLEFSHPNVPGLKPLYDAYSFKVLPWLGEVVAKDSESYQYLAESIRMHPDQETLKDKMASIGFACCQYHNLSGGIVALHRGVKA